MKKPVKPTEIFETIRVRQRISDHRNPLYSKLQFIY